MAEHVASPRQGVAVMPLSFVRLRPGCGPERSRVVHLTDIEGPLTPWEFSRLPGTPAETSGSLRVLCGSLLIRGTYDVLPGLSGMPCETCVLRSPRPGEGETRALPRQPRHALPAVS